MPNPSEIQRKDEEAAILARSVGYGALAASRNSLRHGDALRFASLVILLREGRLSKSVKEDMLREVRQLEKKLGVELGNYNSNTFNT